MELNLIRDDLSPNTTIGQLFIDSQTERECYILEDKYRGDAPKVKGETCIPNGRYEVVLAWSNRFGKLMLRLLNVPRFDGILIHPGNTKKDTLGCLLPGQTKAIDFVGNSVAAYNALFLKITYALKTQKVFINISVKE